MSSAAQDSDHDPFDTLREALGERLARAQIKLPLMPRVAQQVMEMTQDESSGAGDLAKLIERDPVLCAHILRVANSPLYAPSSRMVSVRQAVARLGTELLSQIAMSVALKGAIFSDKRFEAPLLRTWKRSLGRAFFAKTIARHRRVNVERAFLCGLMQDIGRPIAYHVLSKLIRRLDLPVPEAVESIVDEFQLRAGVLLAEQWELPEVLRDCIAHSDDYHRCDRNRDEIMTTYLAGRFTLHALDPDSYAEEDLRENPVIADLNLYPETIDEVFGQIANIMETVESLS